MRYFDNLTNYDTERFKNHSKLAINSIVELNYPQAEDLWVSLRKLI